METRIFHGEITPKDLANSLIGEFNKGNWRSQAIGSEQEIVVQIATRDDPTSGGQTAMAVTLREIEDGVAIQIGKQSWYGVAASLGKTALFAIHNPWSLLERLDDLAQDMENLKLSEEVWQVLERTANTLGASFELSERLRRLVCEYCLTANPVGEPSCIACGAPLGKSQPRTCQNCGFVVRMDETFCPNCKKQLV